MGSIFCSSIKSISRQTFIELIRGIQNKKTSLSDIQYFKRIKYKDIDQLYRDIDSIERNRLFTEEQVKLFKLFYEYYPKQKAESLSGLPYKNENNVYRLEYQPDIKFQNPRRILVIGCVYEGKSLFINALANTLLVGYPDKFRYHVCEYDYQYGQQSIQECNIMEEGIQYQFLEVQGYSQDEERNKIIMRNTYRFLREKNVGIDFILICRKYSNSGVSFQEKQIIFNLTEIFSKAFIKQCIIINTQHDSSSSKNVKLEESLNGINRIYDQMPAPKQLYVNSRIDQAELENTDEFNLAQKRFENIERARDSLLQIFEQKEHKPIFAIEEETFNYRREEESRLQHQIQQLKQSLIELKPTLQNYFAIFEKNENDPAFYVEQVTWQEIDQEESKTIELQELLDKIILNDNQTIDVEKRVSKKFGIQNKSLLASDIKQESDKLKMIILKDRCNREKDQRLDYIQSVSNRYIESQQTFLNDTFWDPQLTASELIKKHSPLTLRRYLAQGLYPDQNLDEQGGLSLEFNRIKQSLGLVDEMNDVVYQTQLLQGVV